MHVTNVRGSFTDLDVDSAIVVRPGGILVKAADDVDGPRPVRGAPRLFQGPPQTYCASSESSWTAPSKKYPVSAASGSITRSGIGSNEPGCAKTSRRLGEVPGVISLTRLALDDCDCNCEGLLFRLTGGSTDDDFGFYLSRARHVNLGGAFLCRVGPDLRHRRVQMRDCHEFLDGGLVSHGHDHLVDQIGAVRAQDRRARISPDSASAMILTKPFVLLMH